MLSYHHHLVASPESAQRIATFVDYVAGNLAREVGRLRDWGETSWARLYRAIGVSDEEDAQAGCLAHLLGQGVKEGLVERPQQWPGVQCARALLAGSSLNGTAFDRTALYQARRRGEG